MFYAYLRGLVVFLLWVVNGNAHYHNEEKILKADDNYILVAPHRTFWDPVYMAFAARPKQFIFMAKKELFTNRLFAWWIKMCGAFPIDRENPGQDAIRYPVNVLKKQNRSLVMFPSGSRHSKDVKGGVAVIAKMAKVKIMPAAYAGPMTPKGLLAGERVDMNFGNPIDISDIKRMNDEGIAEVANRIQAEFDRLDQENQIYQPGKKRHPLTYIYRIPLALILVVILLLTMLFSYIASFIWMPEKHR
ncbi:1-acyl-sn-glycerol-3-phosphate acyltransferase [Streptococcus iniae]|uniref:1-acyl-sn-glycerol-3-phosphate acyltransferase n=1 Tax=Streptococcus iniae TaxID=1346 RepID=A0A1J0MXX7_STRIN|nr:1-acyl-sn-glycerol-3-phosphate acyltransferase [Streptococcus iniae]AGM98397.1 1-acyl-sn-glycerol-3-phosphate acyltransferase [Streptococcus iniae SF1]AHY15443.1 acyl-phosphate glycerol 3-phosphate acyltransferase [Streptococcus iniae]AHY17311.1 acyl-phosphate glycerol 3-phosphate acyltransferase [Streptococcus iniae]AJG25614.1 acyl-phosphate glycerol 3-phosphate acyltransferase [Streptococcus iniae]APD31486.1 1-acyl-sn-glycerol-3-phosphate acyltransferase [Streptococcus iniae]